VRPRAAFVFQYHSETRNYRSGRLLSKADRQHSREFLVTACSEGSASDIFVSACLPRIAHRAISEGGGCRAGCGVPALALSGGPRGGRSWRVGGRGRRLRRLEGRDRASRCATAIGAPWELPEGVLEPERSPLDGGSRDPCHLEGGGLRATLRQWQGPARALPGGGGGGAPRRVVPGRGGGGSFRRASAVEECAGVAVRRGRPDTPFRGWHGAPTLSHRRRHAHPAAADFRPPTTPASTANATPPPSHRPRAPPASLVFSIPLAPPPRPDAIGKRRSLCGAPASPSHPPTPRCTLGSLLLRDLAWDGRCLHRSPSPPPTPIYWRRTARACCLSHPLPAPHGVRSSASLLSLWTARRRRLRPLRPCWQKTTARM